jgi:hypothetical protein
MKFLDGQGMHDTRDSPSIAKEYDNDDDDTSRLDCFRNVKEQEGRDSLFLLFVCLPEVGLPFLCQCCVVSSFMRVGPRNFFVLVYSILD